MRLSRIPLYFFLCVAITATAQHPARGAPPSSLATTSKAAPKLIAAGIQAQARGKLKKFYATRGFWPMWAADGSIGKDADALLGFLETADIDGLKPDAYDVDELRAAIAEARAGDPGAVAAAELALSQALGRYVSDLRRPAKSDMIYSDKALKPGKPRVETILRAASLPESLEDYVSSMGWMSPQYVRVRKLVAQALDAGGSEEVVDRLRLNLERARLLPSAWVRHIVVDASSGRLWYYQAGKQVGMMKVVVGTPQTPTPMLAGMLHYAILNPYWNVPTDLAQRNIAPKVLGGRSLKSMGFEALSDWSASPQRLDPATIDWHAVAAGDQELRLRQLPGRGNSMGRVKFLFPNDYGIYLHDTPDRHLFAKRDRHFSNGCIRLEDAATLGKWLLGKSIATASKDPEQTVALTAPVPVYLTYFTATPTERGVGFLKDVYHRDE